MAAKIFVLSAPSGAGKSTLKDKMLEVFPQMKYSISATTRPKRPGEFEGEHYFFKSPGEFAALKQENAFVETMEVHGNQYGTLKSHIQSFLDAGEPVVMDLDVYGKKNFDLAFPEAVGILILPPSLEVLRDRLKQRGSETEETLSLRLKNAEREMDFARTEGKYEYTIINENLGDATRQLVDIVKKEL